MKISKKRVKEIIKEELVRMNETTVRLSTMKDANFEPGRFVQILGKKGKVKLDKKSVKFLAKWIRSNSGKHGMGWSFTEGKLNEGKTLTLPNGVKAIIDFKGITFKTRTSKPVFLDRGELLKFFRGSTKYLRYEGKVAESWDSPQPYSSKEAKQVIDGALRNYAKDLRKVQYRVVKDWMSKAKSGVIDYFDLQRGLQTGDIKRAHPYETEFLHKVLTKDKIIDRFRKYFGGKKAFEKRRKRGY
tara:strand:+ start:60 stop:788 length:729 start_codon:yes stop_codon:yes gene_type:complete